MITIGQIRSFVAVARERHFTQAALRLGVAQPSVSYQVRELERQLKVRLIEVVGRKVYLSDAGERLFERAAALLNEFEDLEAEMSDWATGTAGRLRLGATRTVGGYALPEVLASFRAAHPGIELRLTIDNTEAIEQLLLERRIDMGVVEWQVASPALRSQSLRRDSLVLVAAPSHPLAARASIRLDDLRGQPFILREPGSGTRALAEQALGAVAEEIIPVIELDQPEGIVRLVEAGLGLTFISRSIVSHELADGTLCALAVEGLDLGRHFLLVELRTRAASPAMRAFSAHLVSAWAGA
ncbi:MAG: LysR family transcriptional regulator [Chloroflexota bacterium]